MAETNGKSGGLEIMPVWRRRKWLALWMLAIVLTGAASVAVFLPDRYKGTAVVLIERQEMTESLARPSGETDELELRLQTIEEKLLSRARLENLINQFKLYSRQRRGGASTETVIQQMRRDIKLEPKGIDPTGGHGPTISFALNYWGDSPKTAADVANTLATSYVEDNLKTRERQATSSAKFLKAQLDAAKARLDASSAEQARLIGRRDSLAKKLSSMEPTPGVKSPEVLRLEKLREELTELRTKLRDTHPEVIRLRNEIALVESRVAASAASDRDRTAPADTAAALEIKDEMAAADTRLLQSDYGSAKDKYLALTKLYEEARLSESMEQDQQGDKVTVLDPAVVPDEPASPNRPRILLAGLAISLGLALGAVVLAERLDTSFHTVDDLSEFTRVPVLTSIPRIETKKIRLQRWYRLILGLFLAAIILPLVVGVSYYIARYGEMLILTIAGGRA
jgi:polysaccharide biosynthesis transport protein